MLHNLRCIERTPIVTSERRCYSYIDILRCIDVSPSPSALPALDLALHYTKRECYYRPYLHFITHALKLHEYHPFLCPCLSFFALIPVFCTGPAAVNSFLPINQSLGISIKSARNKRDIRGHSFDVFA